MKLYKRINVIFFMDRLEILNILNDWNFWKRDIETGVERAELLERLKYLAKTKEIVVVKGIRRSGKSTLLLQFCKSLIDSGVKKENILIVNFEDPRFKQLDLDLLNKIYEVYLTELSPDEKHFVVLDEVQTVSGWEKFARYLHESKRVGVFVTGSSSKLLSSEYSTVLAGRHLDIEVRPLSFREFLKFSGIGAGSKLEISSNRHKIKRALSAYLKWGGFPKVSLAKTENEKRDLLNTYFKDIIIKDISVRHKINQTEKLEELAKYYLSNISTLQSFNKIKNFLKLNLDTVERFSSYLAQVYLLSFVRKFSFSNKEQILNPRKVYCSDTGIRNSVSFVFSSDFGRLAENVVFNNLQAEGLEIFYWKGVGEVDFIAKKGKKISAAIQVCWNPSDKETKEREIKGLEEACKKFKLKSGLVLTEDYSEEEKVGRLKIVYKPLWEYLLEQ